MYDIPDDPIITQIERFGYPLWFIREQERKRLEREETEDDDEVEHD